MHRSSRPASRASSVGSHASGISHPPGSRKRRQASMLDGVSSDTLISRVGNWDDGHDSLPYVSREGTPPYLYKMSPPPILLPTDRQQAEGHYPTASKMTRPSIQASRGASAPASPSRHLKEETSNMPNFVKFFVDMKSGSWSQAEKRKANSDTSRRFRNRKRNEMQMEQRIHAQQEEIRLNKETIQRQSEEIRTLIQQRDRYHTEREFYRDYINRLASFSHLLSRPSSPQSSLIPAPGKEC